MASIYIYLNRGASVGASVGIGMGWGGGGGKSTQSCVVLVLILPTSDAGGTLAQRKGIMCAMSELNGVPSCANKMLMKTM